MFIETSAKEDVGVTELFHDISKKLPKTNQEKISSLNLSNDGIILNSSEILNIINIHIDNDNAKQGCCWCNWKSLKIMYI